MNIYPLPQEVHDALDYINSTLSRCGNDNLVKTSMHYHKTIKNSTASLDTLHQYALLAMQAQQHVAAEVLLRHATDIAPHSSELQHNRGIALRQLGRQTDAIECFEKALQITPYMADAYIGVAEIYQEQKIAKRLIEWLEHAVTYCPNNANLLVLLGEAIKNTGQSQQAIDYFRKALKLSPDNAYIHQTLAHTKHFTTHDADVEAMEAFHVQHNLTTDQKIRLGFSLGKVYEDLKDYRKSFFYYKNANDEKRHTSEYNHEDSRMLFESIQTVFDRKLFEKYQSVGNDSRCPIFILGMPRSGTTLVEQMLASHPEVHGAGELLIIQNMVSHLWQMPAVNGALFPHGIDRFPMNIFTAAGQHYIQMLRQLTGNHTVPRITDKMPHNFLFLGMIKLFLPHAKVLHCRRDPVDTCFSIYKHLFTGSHDYAYNLSELGRYYRMYDHLMTHWHEVLPGFICDIEHEKLVENPEEQLQLILKFCELPWNDACLNYYESGNIALTASSVQVKRPVYKDSLQYWRRYEKFLGSLLDELYPL